MDLVRRLVLLTLKHNILFQACHVRGVDNFLADYLSRSQIARFRQLHPTATSDPTTIPRLPALPS
jgi:hypothetical protein